MSESDSVAAHEAAQTHHYELAWAAGFFDGEGTTTARYITTGRVRPGDLRLAVPQSDLEVLRRFQRAVRGLGRISPRKVLPGRKSMWTWTAHSFEAVQAVVAMLWPFLSEPKRVQALRVFRAIDFKSIRSRVSICSKGHSLSDARIDGRGWRHCRSCDRARRAA